MTPMYSGLITPYLMSYSIVLFTLCIIYPLFYLEIIALLFLKLCLLYFLKLLLLSFKAKILLMFFKYKASFLSITQVFIRLHFKHLCVYTIFTNQILMGARFNYATMIHNIYFVYAASCSKSMRNQNQCFLFSFSFN